LVAQKTGDCAEKQIFPCFVEYEARKVRGPAGIIRQLDPKRTRSGEIS
jgi:hypothetical protein